MKEMLLAAKTARNEIANLTTEQKNAALRAMANALLEQKNEILKANAVDLESASATISSVMLDRLRLTPERIDSMAAGILDVVNLPDPVGHVLN